MYVYQKSIQTRRIHFQPLHIDNNIMFATLKNKIKEETGNEVPTLPPVRTSQNRYQRGALDSTSSVSIESLSMFEQVRVEKMFFIPFWRQRYQPKEISICFLQKEAELCVLRTQFNDINSKYNDLSKRYNILQDDMERLEKANELLEESVKVSQGKNISDFAAL